jgi:2-hydroxychromene-2-carboxylate isomerase
LDGSLILQTASKEEASKALEENTQRAIDADVFGVPSYVIEGEVYWGQDRLNFLEDHLSS